MATAVQSQPRAINRLRRSKSVGIITLCSSFLHRNKSMAALAIVVLFYSLFVFESLHVQHHAIDGLRRGDAAVVQPTQLAEWSSKHDTIKAAVRKEGIITVQEESQAPEKFPSDHGKCSFRHYPERRYYGLPNVDQPEFLLHAEYIYGERPVVLQEMNLRQKLCVNQTEWLDEINDSNKLPFADGTNPSIVHIDRLRTTVHYDSLRDQGVTYVATICMTNSQCQWRDTPQEVLEYKLSTRVKPNTVRTLFLLLDDKFQVLKETTITFERDALWGNQKFKPSDSETRTEIRALDDARLFVYQNKLWVSFRDGRAFGYDRQVLNPLHISPDQVLIRASETLSFCCGRNMALMTPADHTLQSLTWVDPVTVIDVHTVQNVNETHRRLLEAGRANKKSHIHGTNAFMVPYGQDELLGMAHFHRPFNRDENVYARFGHHYTHAFFTISANTPFRLKRLSAEFVLPSYHHANDAEIIQFISGLELHDDQVVLAWGINDCEGAAGTISVDVVNRLLRNVPEGKEVVDFMLTGAATTSE
ncbi:hypothetical protein MHU86_6197 [Fragilaria crotonensis]|nr:hypothetical protein MHU86_6197 [Fragilaria crotonensis]